MQTGIAKGKMQGLLRVSQKRGSSLALLNEASDELILF